MSGKKGKSKGASADGDAAEASGGGGGKGGTSVKVLAYAFSRRIFNQLLSSGATHFVRETIESLGSAGKDQRWYEIRRRRTYLLGGQGSAWSKACMFEQLCFCTIACCRAISAE